MKKVIVTSCAILCMLGVSAVDYGSEPLAESKSESSGIEKIGREAMDGLYVAAGISYLHTKSEVDHLDNNISDNLGNPSPLRRFNKLNECFGKVGGNLALGYGKFTNEIFYIGGEFLIDMSGKDTKEQSVYGNVINLNISLVSQLKTSGVIPSLAMKFGLYCDQLDTMFYAKAGIARVSSELKEIGALPAGYYWSRNGFKTNKITPILGLGAETKVGPVNVRLDFDYKFQTYKDDYVESSDCSRLYLRNAAKGYAVRLMLVYNISRHSGL